MSKMSELHSQQEVLDMIKPSRAKRKAFDASVAISQLILTDIADLIKEGVTASTIKTLKDQLEWLQMALYAEEQKDKTDV